MWQQRAFGIPALDTEASLKWGAPGSGRPLLKVWYGEWYIGRHLTWTSSRCTCEHISTHYTLQNDQILNRRLTAAPGIDVGLFSLKRKSKGKSRNVG